MDMSAHFLSSLCSAKDSDDRNLRSILALYDAIAAWHLRIELGANGLVVI